MDQTYWQQIERFNQMYKLGVPAEPVVPTDQEILDFKSILSEEVEEADDIVTEKDPHQKLVAFSDWLADIVVYCSTKARQHGLPLDKILSVIMESNFSKLGEDGKPIYDARNKVLKGPGYWKPEPKISEILKEMK